MLCCVPLRTRRNHLVVLSFPACQLPWCPPAAPCRYGFGANKRICLYDTLIKQASQEPVVAVLAHELSHW